MNCKIEKNSRLYDVLSALEIGYSTGKFDALFPYLAKDCIMESQWVLQPNTGYEAVTDYFTKKGITLVKSDNFPTCVVVELLGNCNPIKNAEVTVGGKRSDASTLGLMYEPGKLCLEMKQTIDEKENIVIVDATLDETGMVKRIDLCMPELFRYRAFDWCIELYPATDEETEETDDYKEHLIRVGEPYYDSLYVFMNCSGERFDEYDNLHIPMDKWVNTLEFWKTFVSSTTFDEAFERLAGINYDENTVQRPDVAKVLGRKGKRMWEDRENSMCMLEGLIEWTELYKNTYSYINTIGW